MKEILSDSETQFNSNASNSNKTQRMRAVWFESQATSIEDIKIHEIPKPTLKPGQALVRVKVAGTNPTEKLIFAQVPLPGWKFPTVCGVDFSGVVESVADDVSQVQPGDAVFACNWNSGHADPDPAIGGAFGEYIAIAAYKLSKKPEALSFETAASIGCIAVTSYQTIIDIGEVLEGTKLLVLGGSTAVGSLAIQLAKLRGAYVVATASSRASEYAQQTSSPDRIINYETQRWDEVPDIKNFDVVLDCSPEKDTIAKALKGKVVRDGGKFISITDWANGFDSSAYPPLSWAGFYGAHQNTAHQDFIADLLAQGKVKVPIESRFPFTQEGVSQIIGKILSGKSLGKNILLISE